ncbi:MAG: hypothetical protein AB7U20_18140 [Planctomycetaceae bacterium]
MRTGFAENFDDFDATWDAWDRLVKVVDGSNTVAEYEYDGLHRRIVKSVYASGSHDHDEHFYLSEDDQVLEVRLDSDTTPYIQYTWGERYIDDLVFRTRDTDDNGTLDETLYVGWPDRKRSGAAGTRRCALRPGPALTKSFVL